MFCCQIRVLLFHGNETKRSELYPLLCKKDEVNGTLVCPVVLTSFEIPLREKMLRKVRWSYIVVDEGHRLKNYKSMLARYTETLYNTEKIFLDICYTRILKLLMHMYTSPTFVFLCMFYTAT
jgi:hypothetical protein